MNANKSGNRFAQFAINLFAIFVVLTLVVSIFFNFALAFAVASLSDMEQQLPETTYKTRYLQNKGKAEEKILVIPVSGMIIDSTQGWDEGITSSQEVQKKLEQAKKNNNIKALVLKIQSPGGTVNATDKIYREITKWKEQTQLPVVAYLDSVAASGGYYTAVAADKIIGSPYGITGSIGVIMSFYQTQELFENKLGIKQVVIKSGEHKDLGSAMRPVTEEERKILNGIVQQMYQRFVSVVKEGRPALAELSEEQFAKLTDGRVFTGIQAQESGLIDGLGDLETACKEAAKLAEIQEDAPVIYYESQKSFLQELMDTSVKNTPPTLEALESKIRSLQTPGAYYLWR